MQNTDLATLHELKNALESKETTQIVNAVVIKDPALEVEQSLASFLKHRLAKLQEASDFEENIKEVILTRLSEATFPQLIGLLEVVQKNNNIATEKVLAPFIAQTKSVTETLRNREEFNKTTEKEIYENTDDKSVLQSLHMLSQLLDKSAS